LNPKKEEQDMNTEIIPGITHSLSLQVSDRLLVTAVSPDFPGFAGLPPVFATAFLVGFMEWACIEALRPYLPAGKNTVGTHVYLSHVAPTPAGMTVTAKVELIEVKDRTLRFRVDCFDECDLIGSGFHERTLIDTGRFMAKVAEKAARGMALTAA
jgi:fluoroacetyl-CoA thioesterase